MLLYHNELIVGEQLPLLDKYSKVFVCLHCVCVCLQSANFKMFLGKGYVYLVEEMKFPNLFLNSCVSRVSALKKVGKITSVPK